MMNIVEKLGFNSDWINLGLLTTETIKDLEQEFMKGEDTNTEHYRWRVFKRYIEAKDRLDLEDASALFKLGENDPDKVLGRAMMVEILEMLGCPNKLLEAATSHTDKVVSTVAIREMKKRLDLWQK